MEASGSCWQQLKLGAARGQVPLEMKPRTVQKEHRNNLMPFQRAYIKAKGFRVRYNLFYLVRLLVSVSLKIDYRCTVSRLS